MTTEKRPYIELSQIPNKEDNTLYDITAHLVFAFVSEQESNGMYTYYIPCFDICFSADNKQEGDELVQDAMDGFVKYWILSKGIDMFIRHLKVLGFNPAGDIWASVLRNKKYASKFVGGAMKKPQGFVNAEYHYSELAIAS